MNTTSQLRTLPLESLVCSSSIVVVAAVELVVVVVHTYRHMLLPIVTINGLVVFVVRSMGWIVGVGHYFHRPRTKAMLILDTKQCNFVCREASSWPTRHSIPDWLG